MAITERASGSTIDRITGWLGDEAESLLGYTCKGIGRERLMLPGPDHVDQAFGASDRKPPVLVNLQRLYGHGRLAVATSVQPSARSAFWCFFLLLLA